MTDLKEQIEKIRQRGERGEQLYYRKDFRAVCDAAEESERLRALLVEAQGVIDYGREVGNLSGDIDAALAATKDVGQFPALLDRLAQADALEAENKALRARVELLEELDGLHRERMTQCFEAVGKAFETITKARERVMAGKHPGHESAKATPGRFEKVRNNLYDPPYVRDTYRYFSVDFGAEKTVISNFEVKGNPPFQSTTLKGFFTLPEERAQRVVFGAAEAWIGKLTKERERVAELEAEAAKRRQQDDYIAAQYAGFSDRINAPVASPAPPEAVKQEEDIPCATCGGPVVLLSKEVWGHKYGVYEHPALPRRPASHTPVPGQGVSDGKTYRSTRAYSTR